MLQKLHYTNYKLIFGIETTKLEFQALANAKSENEISFYSSRIVFLLFNLELRGLSSY